MANLLEKDGEQIEINRRELLEVPAFAAEAQTVLTVTKLTAGIGATISAFFTRRAQAQDFKPEDLYKAEDRNPMPGEIAFEGQFYAIDIRNCSKDTNHKNGIDLRTLGLAPNYPNVQFVVLYFATTESEAARQLIENSKDQQKPADVLFIPVYELALEQRCKADLDSSAQMRTELKRISQLFKKMGAKDVYDGSPLLWNCRKNEKLPAAIVLNRKLEILDKPDFGDDVSQIPNFWDHVLVKARQEAKNKISTKQG